MPQTRGISIIIDQDQEQVVYNEQRQQVQQQLQQQMSAKQQQKQEQPGTIKINQTVEPNQLMSQPQQQQQQQQQPKNNTAELTTTTTKTTTTTTVRQMSLYTAAEATTTRPPPLPAPTAALPEDQLENSFKPTLIDIKCHNESNNNDYQQRDHNDDDDNEESNAKKCGEFVNINAIANETGYSTVPQLLLQIAKPNGQERNNFGKLERVGVENALNSTPIRTINNGSCAAERRPSAKLDSTNDNNPTATATTTKTTTIIKCYEQPQKRENKAAEEKEESLQHHFVGMGAAAAADAEVAAGAVANTVNTNGENHQYDVGNCVRKATTTTTIITPHQNEWSVLENTEAVKELVSLTTKAANTSATTVNGNLTGDTHVVKIQIKPNSLIANKLETNNSRQVTVVQLNETSENPESEILKDYQLNLNNLINENVEMVQKQTTTATQSGNVVSSGGTTVTDLNMSNSPYHLYYMMSSGQFSPCETLDSGTGSDLESNGNAASSPTRNDSGVAKLEMHLKTTKIRINGGGGGGTQTTTMVNGNNDKLQRNGGNLNKLNEHLRACSLTDSEESETSVSSLSCDSLHSTEFTRQLSVSPTENNNNNNNNKLISANKTITSTHKSIESFLPDSLLRDIRDRKYATNDFDTTKYDDNNSQSPSNDSNRQSLESVNEHHDYVDVAHTKFINSSHLSDKRSSLPNKTFILNQKDGTFIDTKLNSMPSKYDDDQFYNFHVNEHANFRSFGNIVQEQESDSHDDDCHDSLPEYRQITRTLRDDDFAGYKDIRSGSNTSTIRSSKGTVRGVKNRVRNGIATFLQLQQPNGKNFKEKDIGKVVLYTTSMGIIRDTYAKCANVKQILRTLLVKFEERDVFMSVEYQQEIKERMNSATIRVPQLFVEGQHIGDADTVERLNESGELRQLLKPYKSIATAYTCQTCGGYRLLPCPSCNGSKKSVHRNHFTAEFVALKCMNCDEVGLVKCHNC